MPQTEMGEDMEGGCSISVGKFDVYVNQEIYVNQELFKYDSSRMREVIHMPPHCGAFVPALRDGTFSRGSH